MTPVEKRKRTTV